MQLSTEDMKRLMTGGASIYQTYTGQPSPSDYWIQAYLGACAWVDSSDEKFLYKTKAKELNRPAPAPLQEAFATWAKDPDSWDYRELTLLCKAYQFEFPALYLTETVFHPRQRQHTSDVLLEQAQHLLQSLGMRYEQSRLFATNLKEDEFLSLTPLDRKLSCRFRWMTKQDPSWVHWLNQCTAQEQFEILLENIYRPYTPVAEILRNWGHTRSKKLQSLLHILAWKHPEVSSSLDASEWLLSPSEAIEGKTKQKRFSWPTPPLLKNMRLTENERQIAWLPPKFQKEGETAALHELSIHSAYLYGDKQQLKQLWPRISFDENAIDLYRAAAKQLEPKFFLTQYAEASAETNFPPEQIDQVQKWIYASDVFVPADQSSEIWSLMEKWAEMPEVEEPQSELQRMGHKLSNRIHPSVISNANFDPFDFFDAACLTQWEDQLKKRRSLYQTLARWQKDN